MDNGSNLSKPRELIRQGNRVKEQYNKLKNLINTIKTGIVNIKNVMTGYDESNIIAQMDKLSEALDTYVSKSNRIYDEVSETLVRYGENLLYNLEELSDNISHITSAINNLP